MEEPAEPHFEAPPESDPSAVPARANRVYEALRRSEQAPERSAEQRTAEYASGFGSPGSEEAAAAHLREPNRHSNGAAGTQVVRSGDVQLDVNWREVLSRCAVIPFRPAPETHLINLERPHEVPGEEFRSLRTRLNHLQSQQGLRSLVVSSASPAEGKTFTAVNLALAQAQLESPVLLADLDLRRPIIHNIFQIERVPGFSDFLVNEAPLEACIRRIEGTNLYILPAGRSAKNPLELLNMRQVKYTLDSLRKIFNWIILDTPPILFSADANLLSTLTDGTLIVVRIGATTYDNVIRAMQSLCENNVVGIVANGARAGELYSKYTYYYSTPDEAEAEPGPGPRAEHASEADAGSAGPRTSSE